MLYGEKNTKPSGLVALDTSKEDKHNKTTSTEIHDQHSYTEFVQYHLATLGDAARLFAHA